MLLYYCGHGDFLRDRTYYLTLKETEPENEAFTGLPLRQMKLALETQLTSKRVFLVLDCCFSGQGLKEWMATGIGHVIEDDVLRAFPRKGTALIAASTGVAVAPAENPDHVYRRVRQYHLKWGSRQKERLSFHDIVDEVRARIAGQYGSSGITP